ncbi:hypothetical protein PVL30_005608 [Lodderomyces elongisporus]|uniref:uncharacterized protein n=1 Tax=Lodderomyces elongisporus TaxID=36914 RepID=UPI0029274FAA|nr:uncharacterized protein PVL30_005608 [Lodderomyces elongisporus]WLF81808.1 hypothetical protein PVL30_005608 [Lodderomyces elongisporus]
MSNHYSQNRKHNNQQELLPPSSPLFPASQLTNQSPHNTNIFTPTLPDKPTCSTSSLSVYIIPSEQNLFVQGFDPREYISRPPTILRGTLFIRVIKPTKIKSISLSFRGVQRTEWPEGIPPKKNSYAEVNDVINHTWPFFQTPSAGGSSSSSGNATATATAATASSTSFSSPHNGADFYIERNGANRSGLNDETSASNVNVAAAAAAAARSPSPAPRRSAGTSTSLNSTESSGNFLSRNLSPSFLRRSKSPSIGSLDAAALGELTTVTSPSSDPQSQMHFAPGDYLYNFEHPLPPSIPESCNVTFGSTAYNLEVSIQRPGTFKSNLSGKLPINIIRTPSELNMEENESIVISRDWEDQIKYDIVIGAKSVVLNSYLPLAFRFVPLWGKVALHRIRIYLTENLEYYCNNKKVHRMEPPKKFLLLEHKARKGRSLLQTNPHDESEVGLDQYDEDVLPKELEFQLYVPKDITGRGLTQIHPDTSYENIQAHHWIKICLRISKQDPENPQKRKHYEISIDSPLHVLSPLAAHGNTLLPAYDDLIDSNNNTHTPASVADNILSPGVTPVDYHHNHHSHHSHHSSNEPTPEASSSSTTAIRSMLNNNRRSSSPGNRPVIPDPDILSPARSIEFHHIKSELNLAGLAGETEANMHLDANLYKPETEETISTINSPQARPHDGTFTSPLNSPIQRPIHLIRKPSIAPPPFDEAAKDPKMSLHPPAYQERDEGSLSLSPLRIDDTNDASFANPLNPSSSSKGISSLNAQSNTPVRDLLIQQLNGSRSESAQDTQTQQSSASPITENNSSTLPQITIDASDSSHEEQSIAKKENKTENKISAPAKTEEKDLADDEFLPVSPSLPAIGSCSRRNRERTSTDGSSDKMSPSPRRTSNAQAEYNNNKTRKNSTADNQDMHSSSNSRSRASSISSISSEQTPLDQTMPLLNQSTSSIATHNAFFNSGSNMYATETNQSIGSSIYDLAYRRPSQVGTKPAGVFMSALGNDIAEDEFRGFNSLHHLRNPRIGKHYQNFDNDNDNDAGMSTGTGTGTGTSTGTGTGTGNTSDSLAILPDKTGVATTNTNLFTSDNRSVTHNAVPEEIIDEEEASEESGSTLDEVHLHQIQSQVPKESKDRGVDSGVGADAGAGADVNVGAGNDGDKMNNWHQHGPPHSGAMEEVPAYKMGYIIE